MDIICTNLFFFKFEIALINFNLIKKSFFVFLFLPLVSFSQNLTKITLDEVIMEVEAIPKITIDGSIYSMRKRNQYLKKILSSRFWDENFVLNIDLESFETKKKVGFKNKGEVRIFINGNQLNRTHLFKNKTAIENLLSKTQNVEIKYSRQSLEKDNFPSRESENHEEVKFSLNKVPVIEIRIRAYLDSNILYNKRQKNISFENQKYGSIKTVQLEEVEVVQNKIVDGVVYSPRQVDGQITFKKNNRLTRLAKQSERYKRQGLNEWGINTNANTWYQALRVHIGGKAAEISYDGLPIFFPITTINNDQVGPLWVIDGIYMNKPPAISSIVRNIREVKILKYSGSSLYGTRGSEGVIIIKTANDLNYVMSNVSRKLPIKGKKNRDILYAYESFEKDFNLRINTLEKKIEKYLNEDDFIKVDSISKVKDEILVRGYLFTANYINKNVNYEVAPYLALTKISDIKISFLDTIASNLSDEVKASKYGKILIDFIRSRKENE